MKCHSCSPSLAGGIPLVLLLDVLGCLGVLGVLGVEFLFCFKGGYCGSGIHCTGSLATWNCWLLEYWGFLWNLWKICTRLELCRNWFLLALSWFDEVAVSPEALSSCWNLNHVGVGFSALLTYHSFFILPRIRILEPYILSCLEWQCFNSILEIFDIGIELAFFLCYEFSLLADPVIHDLRW